MAFGMTEAGFLLVFILIIVVGFIALRSTSVFTKKAATAGGNRQCPHCFENIHSKAQACAHCQREVR
jgi:hypothetical protein